MGYTFVVPDIGGRCAAVEADLSALGISYDCRRVRFKDEQDSRAYRLSVEETRKLPTQNGLPVVPSYGLPIMYDPTEKVWEKTLEFAVKD